MENFLEKRIGDLNGITFKIPSYQRGYRWENVQIKNLLDDIKEYFINEQNKDKNYYLQPIILKSENDKTYTLIDGQQRLTTIYMIMAYFHEKIYRNNDFDNEIYHIEYTTLKNDIDSNEQINLKEKIIEYLNNYKNKKFNTLNEYYYYLALKCIDEWYNKEQDLHSREIDFLDFIKNNVKVIWYELDENDKDNENEAFIRINTNKIKLTQADLVKAEFLRKDKQRDSNIHCEQVGREWNDIENSLFNDEFWFFISNQETLDRMTQLLEIVIGVYYAQDDTSDDNDENRIYNILQKEIEKNYDNTWNNIKKVFFILSDWYDNIELYNIIGYIVTIKKEEKNTGNISKWLVDAIKVYERNYEDNSKKIAMTKDAFMQNYLKEEIKKALFTKNIRDKMINLDKVQIRENLESLNYLDNKNEIKYILLLHNILTLNNLKDNKIRFAFEKYKNSYNNDNNKRQKVKWDIEHIHSQNEAPIETTEDKQAYLNYLRIFYSNQLLAKKIGEKEYFSKIDKIKELEEEKVSINQIREQAQQKGLKINTDFEAYEHQIGNLALLDMHTNRSYGDSLFMKKREEIIENDEKGFIPICTKKAFLKAFIENKTDEKQDENYNLNSEKHIIQYFEWTTDDADLYTNDIADKLYNGIYKEEDK